MELKALKTFIAVAEQENFSAAARRLNTVQPAISRQIADLEDELAVTLFKRNTREVRITAAGESLLRDAYDLLERAAQAKERAGRAGRGEVGDLRIGYLGPACLSFIPMLVQEYAQRYPDVQIGLSEMTVRQQLDAFRSGQIDIGFSRPVTAVKGLSIDAVELYADSLCALLPETHALSSAESVALDQLKDEDFVLFNRNEAQGLYDQILSLCLVNGFVPAIRNQPNTMQTVVTEVAAGLGVSIVPGCIERLHSSGAVFVAIKGQQPSIPLELHCRGADASPAVVAFIDVALQLIERIQAQVFAS